MSKIAVSVYKKCIEPDSTNGGVGLVETYERTNKEHYIDQIRYDILCSGRSVIIQEVLKESSKVLPHGSSCEIRDIRTVRLIPVFQRIDKFGDPFKGVYEAETL